MIEIIKSDLQESLSDSNVPSDSTRDKLMNDISTRISKFMKSEVLSIYKGTYKHHQEYVDSQMTYYFDYIIDGNDEDVVLLQLSIYENHPYYLTIEKMYLPESLRGHGIATKLLTELKEILKKNDLPLVVSLEDKSYKLNNGVSVWKQVKIPGLEIHYNH